MIFFSTPAQLVFGGLRRFELSYRMMFRFSLRMALVSAVGLLILGCRSQPSLAAAVSPEPLSTPAHQQISKPASADESAIEAHAHYGTGIIHALSEETGPALNEFFAAVRKDPANVPLALEVAQDFIQAGQLEKALSVLEGATNQPDASGELFARLGAIYFQFNRLAPATAACRQAIKKNPLSPEAYAILFQIYLQSRQLKDALNLLDGAVKVSAAPPELLVLGGELYLRLGSQMMEQKEVLQARALAAFQRANTPAFTPPEILLRLAEGFNSLGRSNETVVVYEKLLADFPDLSVMRDTVRAKLADLLLHMGERQRAADLLRQMVADNPTDARAYYFLGSLAYEMTNLVQATEYYSKTILLSPDFEPAYGELASAQLALNKIGDAQATLDAARKKFPRNYSLEYLSGLAALRQKNYTNAIESFTAAEIIARAGDAKQLSEMFYFQLGSAYERLGDLAQAEKNFLTCLTLAPDFDEAQNYLGFMWAEHGTNLDRAQELIGKALKTEPKNAAYLDSMAWVLFKLNQPGPALDFELKAIANSEEEDAEIYKHLGDIYAALGQHRKARESWEKSQQLEPDEEVRKKLEAEPK